jgi:hypothetical protein
VAVPVAVAATSGTQGAAIATGSVPHSGIQYVRIHFLLELIHVANATEALCTNTNFTCYSQVPRQSEAARGSQDRRWLSSQREADLRVCGRAT